MAVASARRYMHDQAGMRLIGAAIVGLTADPYPEAPEGFHRGRYHRLRAGGFRIMYVVDGDLITIERVDSVTAP